jgi:glycosyltransferase involved in cell wall biosynthesis
VVKESLKYADTVYVSDNGSTDNTAIWATKKGAIVCQCVEKGVGANTNFGISIVLEKENPDIIVTLDGDGQHKPDEIPIVLKPILQNQADLVIGSRYSDLSSMPKYRKIGIDIITRLCNIKYKKRIMDGQSCFRAYSKKVLEDILPIEEKGFAFSVETLLKAKARGFRIVEVPITCIYHKDFKDNSTINPIRHGLIVILGVLKWRYKLELLPRIKRFLSK